MADHFQIVISSSGYAVVKALQIALRLDIFRSFLFMPNCDGVGTQRVAWLMCDGSKDSGISKKWKHITYRIAHCLCHISSIQNVTACDLDHVITLSIDPTEVTGSKEHG